MLFRSRAVEIRALLLSVVGVVLELKIAELGIDRDVARNVVVSHAWGQDCDLWDSQTTASQSPAVNAIADLSWHQTLNS